VSAEVGLDAIEPGRRQGDLDDHRRFPLSAGPVYGISRGSRGLHGAGGG